MTRQIGKMWGNSFIDAILYFSLCGKLQLAALMHSWWLMTGVLSDHGILMATYPWLSKAVYRKLLGAATAAVCLPNVQLSAHSLSVSFCCFFFLLCSLYPIKWVSFNSAEHLCHCSWGPSFIFFLSKQFQQTCHSLFLEPLSTRQWM